MSTYACLKTLPPLVNCIVNDSLVHAIPYVQFVNGVQLRLMHLLLDVIPYLVIDRIKVGAIRQIWRVKVGVDYLRNRTVSHAQCAGTLSC